MPGVSHGPDGTPWRGSGLKGPPRRAGDPQRGRTGAELREKALLSAKEGKPSQGTTPWMSKGFEGPTDSPSSHMANANNFTQLYHEEGPNAKYFLKDFIYLFLERGGGWEKERERNINWLPLIPPQLGTWPITQACALTGNQTGDLSVCRTMPTLLSHTSQGQCQLLSPIVLRPCLSFTSPPVHLHLRGLKWGRGEQH